MTRGRSVTGMPVYVHAARDVRVRGHRIQLIRILDNLLDNARRHARATVEDSPHGARFVLRLPPLDTRPAGV
ncbi:hypothetical protein [Actinomadura sp. HBU206391]|uniref:hypothetical protein n=1 Tax=Actinomadura sp. HBU206391 TaxID=2731692 RepID=UPI00164FC6A4|nr:hypothetical protein [Actinomadura sp. HBU206391]MBC6461904.1 hypothetical protein [Actinomadura sp. HBU206391]